MITVFVGVYNRLETLERTIKSYEQFKTPHEIVIVDNGTDNKICKTFLSCLRRENRIKEIYHLPACESMEEATDNFNIAIRDQHEKGKSEWFAVTEADVCFEGVDPNTLDVYLELAKYTGKPVGPHLRVDAEIPHGYALRSRVLACETWMLYREDMHWMDDVPYSNTQIDTTFHLFPRTRFFNRLHMDPLRVGPPYTAMHLDWYIDFFNPTEENKILIPNKRPMGSWGKQWLSHYWSWFQKDPEWALSKLLKEPLHPTDFCNNSFMISWAYQYGAGTEIDLDKSHDWLCRAMPYPNDRYWGKEMYWMKYIYKDDFGSLGWGQFNNTPNPEGHTPSQRLCRCRVCVEERAKR